MANEDQPTGDFAQLQRELDALRRRLDAMDDRLAKMESSTERVVRPPSLASHPRPERDPEPELILTDEVEIIDAEPVEEPISPAEHRPAAAASTYPPSQQHPQPTSPADQRDPITDAWDKFSEGWEDIVAGRWLTWAGALTLIVAMAFFVPWAWTELELPDWSKVLMLHLLGGGLCVAALWLYLRDMKIFAQGIAGVGIFTLYASAWAAQQHYEIWDDAGQTITFIECAIITALAIAAAVSSRSVAMILLGALGGYLTPILASTGEPNHIALFTYLAFLNVALVGTAVLRGWSFLKPIALIATMLMFAAWLLSGSFDEEFQTWSTQWLLTVHWGIFLLGATLPPVVWARRTNWLDLASLSANSLWFVGVTWILFHERAGQQMALFCWGMTLLHLLLFGVTFGRVTNVDRMPRVHLALAAIFFILAMPLQLENSLSYLALAWSAQGLVLTAVSIYFRDRQMAVTSLIVFGLALIRLFAFDYPANPELIGQIDRRFLMFTCTSLMMIVAGAMYPLWGRFLSQDDAAPLDWQFLGGVLMGIGNVVAMIGMTCQWESRIVLLLWTIDAAAIWAAGFAMPRFKLDGAAVRTYALGLAVVMVGGRCLYHLDRIDGTFSLLLNDRFGTLALVAVVYFAAAWAYRTFQLIGEKNEESADDNRASVELSPMERWLDSPIAVLANLVLVAVLTMEVHSWYEAAIDGNFQPFANMDMAEQASYSILWAVYAAIAFAVGLWLRWPVMRYVGLAGLGITLLKVFFVDLASLQLLARVLALAVLGMMLLAVSFLYQRFRRQAQAT